MHTNTFSLLKYVPAIFILSLFMLSACSKDEPLSAVGLLEWDRVELVAETNEPIMEITAREGDMLESGTIILQQDARRLQAKLDESQAMLAQARARLAELVRGPRAEQVDAARANLEGARSQEDYARLELKRVQALLAKKLVSQESVDNAQTTMKKATADKNAIRASLEELLHGTTAEEMQQAEAVVAQAEASVRALTITLSNLTLRAPRAGLLDNLPYEVGERPATGAVIAIMLINKAPYARIYVPEPLRAKVHQGTEAKVYIDGLQKPFSGHVRMISSEAVFTPYYSLTERDRSRLSYLAEVLITDPDIQHLPSGVPVHVEFNVADK